MAQAAEAVAPHLNDVTLDDKYTLKSGRIYLSGIQALVRLPILQYERDKLAGLNTGDDRVITRDVGGVRSFWYYRGDTFLAVDALNDPRAYMVGKRLIEMGKSPAPEVIETAPDLKALLKA